MDGLGLLKWQMDLVTRLEAALRRKLVAADFDCIVWNTEGEELRVEGYEEPAKLARDLDAPLKRANGQLQRVPTMRP